jgi:glycerol-3-phosphate dehydrogenase (NAD(P)+)
MEEETLAMAVITVVGSGQMGSAMSYPGRDKGHEVRLVGTPLDREIIDEASKTGFHKNLKRKLPEGIRYFQFEEFNKALAGADLLISGVSSFGVDWFIEKVLPEIPESLPVLSITKGMINTPEGELVPYPRLYREHTNRKLSLNAVGGPCTAYELADRDHTTVCFCGDDIRLLRRFKSWLETPYYHISLSTDVMGVELAVALKNAYALGVCLSVGLSEKLEGEGKTLHYNSQAALFGQSVKEMRRLLALFGGHDENIVFGAGDLYVTIFGGRTRLIGTLLGRGVSFEKAMEELKGVTLESVVIARRTAAAVRERISRGTARADNFPLLLHIDDIISNNAPVDIPWGKFESETV